MNVEWQMLYRTFHLIITVIDCISSALRTLKIPLSLVILIIKRLVMPLKLNHLYLSALILLEKFLQMFHEKLFQIFLQKFFPKFPLVSPEMILLWMIHVSCCNKHGTDSQSGLWISVLNFGILWETFTSFFSVRIVRFEIYLAKLHSDSVAQSVLFHHHKQLTRALRPNLLLKLVDC